MRIECWCLPVPKQEGERRRKSLMESGMLERGARPRRDRDMLLLPVKEYCEGAVRDVFEVVEVSPSLPRHDLIGGIAIIQERDRAGAEDLLASRPSLHTVLYAHGGVEGEYRTRRFEVLAGEKTCATRYTEYGIRLDIDLNVAYFSPRLSNERQRILSLMEPGEVVFDMFAGVGPFAITLSRKAALVFASDLNPAAVRLMVRNCALNRCGNIIPILADAGHLGWCGMPASDRIIMNHPLASSAFVDAAFRLCRSGGYIHFYALQEREAEFLPVFEERGCSSITERRVRSYSPGRWHAVYDIRVV